MQKLQKLARALAMPLLIVAFSPALVQARESAIHTLDARQAYTYERAVEAFKGQRYAAAYGRFVELADAGHAASARLALMMVQTGPGLFRATWQASPEQLARWNAIVAADTRPRGFGGIASRTPE